ncbi:MAG: PAS domain S-box protein [Desulfobulbaceae bacterium]|nr:PAS domain S-box protein [Desulfobulbaceae bacterium]
MPFNKLCSSSSLSSPDAYKLKNQLQWVFFLRVVVISILLGITVLLQTREHELITSSLSQIAFFIIGTYIFTIFSALLLNKINCYRQYAYLQIIIDCLLASCLVLFTGCSQSIFTIIYFLPIISSSILLFRLGGLLLASLSTFSYAAILTTELSGYMDPLLSGLNTSPLTSFQVALHSFAIRGLSFFLVAILSSILAERLHKAESELTKTSQDLDRLALLYKQIFDDISTGIITVDSRNLITSFNRSAGVITGYDAIDVMGRKIEDIFPELSIKKTETLRPMTLLQKKDGDEIPVGYSWTRLNMPGDCENCRVYTMQDLSRIKKMEEKVNQAEKMAAIGEMAAGIAHEFRNPLAAISGASQVLQGEFEPNTSTRSLMNIIVRECERLEGTISDFLHFSKPATPEKSWFSILGVVQETIGILEQGQKWNSGLTVETNIPEHLDCWADSGQVVQIILNLLENAGNAIGENPGNIIISASEIKVDDLEKTRIEISDNGPGLSDKVMEHIFDPFFTTRENGTGLGLAIVKQLVESNGGEVKVTNKEEQSGAIFSFTLPLPETALTKSE